MAVGAVILSHFMAVLGAVSMCFATGLGLLEAIVFYSLGGFFALLLLSTAMAMSFRTGPVADRY